VEVNVRVYDEKEEKKKLKAEKGEVRCV